MSELELISHRPKTQAQGHPDDFQTPAKALDPLYPFLPRDWTIWEPSCGKGNLVRAFEAHGYRTIGSDVKTGQDFLHWQPGDEWHAVVTNPPFSLKAEFLARCYALGRPFALLLPLTTFETAKRQALFARHGVEVILFPYRIDFETPSGQGTGAWFATAWFTWGLGLDRQLTFWQPETAQLTLEVSDAA